MYDKDWASRIKVEKFRSHNQQWIEMVESIVIDPANHILSGDDEDDNLPPFLSGDLLKHTMLFPSGKYLLLYFFSCSQKKTTTQVDNILKTNIIL